MLSKFLNSQEGIVLNKFLAMMLVITLTFANFIFLGIYFGEGLVSYAKDEENEIKLGVQQKFITNKVYEIENEFKRFVQLEVSSQIENAEGKATLTIPETVIDDLEPENVKVTSYATKFELKNGKVSFIAKGNNKFIVTYVYNEEFTINEETNTVIFNDEPVLNAKELNLIVEVEENKNISAESEKIEYTKQAQFGDLVLVSESLSNLYKGNMYLNKNTEYQKTLKVEITDIEDKLLNEELIINDNDSILKKVIVDEEENFEETEDSVLYKSTVFNKAELLKLFGNNEESYVLVTSKANDNENKTIILFGEYAEEDYADFEVIDITKVAEEDKEIIVNFAENTTEVTVETSIPNREGIFNIKHNKEIVLEENAIVEDIAKLKSNISLESENYNYKAETENEIKEPKTSALLSMEYLNSNQTELSSLIDNEVIFTIDLLSNGPEYKLFDNPVIKIDLPSQVKPVTINESSLALDDGLSIKNISIVDNSILVELNGKQEDYNSEDVKQSISLGAVLSVDRTTPSGLKEITATCKNGEDEINVEAIQVSVFSPVDLIALTTLTVNGNKQTSFENDSMIKIDTFANETTANAQIALVNNHGVDLKDLVLEGTISDKNSTFNTYLKEAIKVDGLNYEIKYFANGEETEDFTLADSFEIAINEMKQGETFNISYTLNVPENLAYNESVFTTLNANYKYEEKVTEKLLNMQITTGKGPSAKIDVEPIVEDETLNGGQVVTYNIKVTNDGDEDIPEAVLSFEAIENGNLVESEENIKDWKITDLKVGETVEAELVVNLANVEEEKTFVGKASLLVGEKTISIVDVQNKIVPADFEISMTSSEYGTTTFSEGEEVRYRINVKNISKKDISNVVVTTKIPDNTSFLNAFIYNEKTNTINEKDFIIENNVINYNIDKLDKGEQLNLILEVEINKIPKECENEIILENYATVESNKTNKCQSNVLIDTAKSAEFIVNLTSNSPVTVNEFDNIEYVITAENVGKASSFVDVIDILPVELSANKITYYTNENDKQEKYTNNQEIEVVELLNPGEKLTVKFDTVVREIEENKVDSINNVAKINLGNGEFKESEVITNIVEKENLQNNSNQEDNNQQNNEKVVENGKYSILGVAWLDENKDGKKESTEKAIENIEVNLINSKGEFIKNSKGEVLTAKTSKDGAYSFDNLANGEYKVLFKYDTSKYQPTAYNAQGISASVNSDAKNQTVTINEVKQTVALTDTIKVENTSVVNIDLGLKENNTFDLSLKKEIKKVTVKNSSGTTDYDFTNTTFTKVEIPGKYFKGSTLVIEYDITVKNDGDITGYVTDILDYMPKELTFNSELNTNWYIDSEGNLHNIALTMEGIEPGKSITEKLILTKTLTTDEAITITNKAEIGSETNTEGLQESDSTPANKAEKEDDFGKAELIVSIKTGGALVYIGITLISLFIISAGIYLINKKVLKGNI